MTTTKNTKEVKQLAASEFLCIVGEEARTELGRSGTHNFLKIKGWSWEKIEKIIKHHMMFLHPSACHSALEIVLSGKASNKLCVVYKGNVIQPCFWPI